MHKMDARLGWLFALAGLGLSLFLYQQLQAARHDGEALRNKNSTLESQLAQMSRAQWAAEEALSKTANTTPEPDTVTTAEPQPIDIGSLFGGLIQDMAPDSQMAAFDAMAESGESGDGRDWRSRRDAMQSRFMEFRYNALVEELGLSPERAEAVQGILAEHHHELYELRRQERDGEITPEELQARRAELETDLNRQLTATLTHQEMAQYQHYEATLPERMMARSLDCQLSDHSNVPRHLRQQLVDTFQEQLINDHYATEGLAIDPFTRSNEAYARTLEQLASTLNAEEYALAQNFFEERIRMQAAMMERMSTWGTGRGSNGRRGGGRSPF